MTRTSSSSSSSSSDDTDSDSDYSPSCTSSSSSSSSEDDSEDSDVVEWCYRKSEKPTEPRKNRRYNLRRKVINPKRFGSLMCEFIGKAVRRQAQEEMENMRKKKRFKVSPPRVKNDDLPDAPFRPDSFASLMRLVRMSAKQPFKDCQDLPMLLEPLESVEALIGMQKAKEFLTDYVVSYAQRSFFSRAEMDHMVIVGPPGCGKTTLARVMAKLFNRMGKIETDKVVEGNRRNMIGSFLGETAKMTQAVIDRALGGVLLIDEAYSLGNASCRSGSTDSYSKACIDTLNQNLTEKGNEFICILVGYKQQMEKDFFAVNEGLSRRFPWRLELTKYKPEELELIFRKMAAEQKLSGPLDGSLEAFFRENRKDFPEHAGSVREFVDKVKVTHSRRVFGKSEKGVLVMSDLKAALEGMREKRMDGGSAAPESMYM